MTAENAAFEMELLVNIYRAFNARQIDSILPFMTSDVDWPNGMEGGRIYGHEGVREYWTRQWSLIDPSVEPVGFEADEQGRTIVNVHQVVRDLAGNVIVDKMVRHIYSIQEGRIKHMEIVEPPTPPADLPN